MIQLTFISLLFSLNLLCETNSEKAFLSELNNIKNQFTEKIQSLDKPAHSGDPQSQLDIARAYLQLVAATHASKTQELRSRAWYWYNKAISNKNNKKVSSIAAKELSYSYFLEENETELRKLSKRNFAPAQYHLGKLLLKKDPQSSEAMDWLEKAGKAKHSEALKSLYQQYNNVFTQNYNPQKSLYWHTQADKNGDIEATYELARIYYSGFGKKWPEFKKDIRKANALYLKAGQHGHTEALVYLGKLYVKAKSYKHAHTVADALIQKKKSEGYYLKARLLNHGWGTQPNKEKAIQLMRTAKEKGHFLAGSDLEIMQKQLQEEKNSKK